MKNYLACAAIVLGLATAGVVTAQPASDNGAMVDAREARLHDGLRHARDTGMLPPYQVRELMRDMRSIRQDEAEYRHQNGGYLTDEQEHRLGVRLDNVARAVQIKGWEDTH